MNNNAGTNNDALESTELGSINPSAFPVDGISNNLEMQNNTGLEEGTIESLDDTPANATAPVEPQETVISNVNLGLDNNELNSEQVPPIGNFATGSEGSVMPPKKKNKALIIIIIIVVLLAILGGFGYFFKDKIINYIPFLNASPKKVFEKTIDSIDYNQLAKTNFKTVSGEYALTIEPGSSTATDALSVQGTIEYDQVNNYLKNVINYKNNGGSITGNMYIDNGHLYFYAKDILDKYIDFSAADSVGLSFDLSNYKDIDIAKVIKLLMNDFKSSLKDEYFTKEKDGDLTKNTLNLTMYNADSISIDFYTNVKNDSELLDLIAKMSGTSKEDMVKDLNELISLSQKAINEGDSEYKEKIVSSISIYTGSKNSVSKIEMISDSNKIVISNIIKGGFDYTISIEGLQITGKVTYSISDVEESFTISLNALDSKIVFETKLKYDATITKDEIPSDKVVKYNELSDIDKLFIQINTANNKALNSPNSYLDSLLSPSIG